jgi:hypothetical protein
VQARDSYYSGQPLIVDDMFDKVEVNSQPVRSAYQPAVLFSQNKPAINNQAAVLFSQNTPAISHQPIEQAVRPAAH